MRGNIRHRLDALERRAPKPQQRTEIRPELRAWLDHYAEGKATGTLTPEDEVFAGRLKAEIKRWRAAGEIGGWGGGY